MIAPIVVAVHELCDCDFQIPWNIIRDLVDVKFDGTVPVCRWSEDGRAKPGCDGCPPAAGILRRNERYSLARCPKVALCDDPMERRSCL